MRILAEKFYIGDAGDNIFALDEVPVMEEGINWKKSSIVVEEVHCTSKDVSEVHFLGASNDFRVIVAGTDLDILKRQLNITAAEINATAASIFANPDQDFCFRVPRSDGKKQLWYCKNFVCEGNLEKNIKIGDKIFLPISLNSIRASVVEEWADIILTNDQSALATTTIKLTVATGEKAVIDWGDDNFEVITGTGSEVTYTHDYGATGTYTVHIMGFVGHITTIKCESQGFISAEIEDLRRLQNATAIDLSGIDATYTSMKLSDWKAAVIDLSSAGLSTTEVDNFLNDLDEVVTSGATGSLNIAGTNAERTTDSDAAVTSLNGKGFSVTVNEAA